MKNYLLLIIIALVATGCSTLPTKNYWNTPYIDTDETLELVYGMSKEEVLSVLGYPLYIEKGWPKNANSNEIVWIYEVRTKELGDLVAFGDVNSVKKLLKRSSTKRPNGVLHKMKLTFNNGKLNRWEPLEESVSTSSTGDAVDEKEESNSGFSMLSMPGFSASAEVTESSQSVSFSPKISFITESYSGYYYGYWDSYYYSNEESDVRLGIDISKPMWGMDVGIDISFSSDGSGVMLFTERKMFGFDWVLGIGNDSFDDIDGSLKFGIFKDIGSYSIGIERIERDHDVVSSFITMKYNL